MILDRIKDWLYWNWNVYKAHAHGFNVMLFVAFLVLNVFDLVLTHIGIQYHGYGEGNCYFQQSVEAGNYVPIILFKLLWSIVLFIPLSIKKFKKVLPLQIIFSVLLLLLVGVYLYGMLFWMMLIGISILGIY